MEISYELAEVSGHEYKHLIIEGYQVPNIKVYENENGYHLVLDDRFGVDIEKQQFVDIGWFLAQSMAVSAGFSSHGVNARPLSPYARMAMGAIESLAIDKAQS